MIALSIIITTYNMANYISRSLESVLMQHTNFNFEIIVSDDCSTDRTINILEDYQKKFGEKIIIIKSPKNTGVVENCKRAIDATRGKYIALLDADDYWVTSDKLQHQYNILINDPKIDFVYTNFNYYDENGVYGGKGIKNNFCPPLRNDFIPYLLAPYISPSCICFRKDFIDFNIFHQTSNDRYASQEYALFLDFTSRGLGFYLNEITMNYTVRKESLSRQSNYKNKIKTFYSSFNVANNFIAKHPISPQINNKRIFNFYLKILLTAWESNSIQEVKKYTSKVSFIQFLKFNPKATYIYIASKNKYLYKIFRPWVLRKRAPGK